jgi:hypothetical protein
MYLYSLQIKWDSQKKKKKKSHESRHGVTTLMACIAVENFLPVFMDSKGKRKKPELRDEMPPGRVVEILYALGALFSISICIDMLYLLFVSCIVTVLSSDSGALLSLSHHATHSFHPLQRSVFKPVKSAFNQACSTSVTKSPEEERNEASH